MIRGEEEEEEELIEKHCPSTGRITLVLGEFGDISRVRKREQVSGSRWNVVGGEAH